jgi:hypothetical protein
MTCATLQPRHSSCIETPVFSNLLPSMISQPILSFSHYLNLILLTFRLVACPNDCPSAKPNVPFDQTSSDKCDIISNGIHFYVRSNMISNTGGLYMRSCCRSLELHVMIMGKWGLLCQSLVHFELGITKLMYEERTKCLPGHPCTYRSVNEQSHRWSCSQRTCHQEAISGPVVAQNL